MKELLEAQKVILKLKAQETVELLETEKRCIQERDKVHLVLNAFVCGSCFAMFIIGVRDANYALACVQLAAAAFMAWRVSREWDK